MSKRIRNLCASLVSHGLDLLHHIHLAKRVQHARHNHHAHEAHPHGIHHAVRTHRFHPLRHSHGHGQTLAKGSPPRLHSDPPATGGQPNEA